MIKMVEFVAGAGGGGVEYTSHTVSDDPYLKLLEFSLFVADASHIKKKIHKHFSTIFMNMIYKHYSF